MDTVDIAKMAQHAGNVAVANTLVIQAILAELMRRGILDETSIAAMKTLMVGDDAARQLAMDTLKPFEKRVG